MSTDVADLIDVYSMSSDAIGSPTEDEMRRALFDNNMLVLVEDPLKLTTARQARNAYHNWKWFIGNKGSGLSPSEESAMQQKMLQRWAQLALQEINTKEKKEDVLAAFNEAPDVVQKSTEAIVRLASFYKRPLWDFGV